MSQFTLLIGLFKKVLGKDAHTVEEALSSGIRLWQLECNSVRTQFPNLDWLSAYLQKVSLRRMDFFIKVYLEAEYHVVGIEGMAVRKGNTAAEFKSIDPFVGGDSPESCQRRLCLLRIHVSVDQISRQESNYFFRWKV
jgi:hypothetical protein